MLRQRRIWRGPGGFTPRERRAAASSSSNSPRFSARFALSVLTVWSAIVSLHFEREENDMCEFAQQSLQEFHRDLIFRLGSALGNLRLIAVGAPFAGELVK